MTHISQQSLDNLHAKLDKDIARLAALCDTARPEQCKAIMDCVEATLKILDKTEGSSQKTYEIETVGYG